MLYFEGINNLIKSETENQRLIASKQIFGKDTNKCLLWRQKIIEILAFVDAEIEFGDEIEKLQHSNIKNNIEKIVEKSKRPVNHFNCKKSCSRITSFDNRSCQRWKINIFQFFTSK